MKPTQEQDHVATDAAALRSGEVLKVIAFAGAGKTTTLKQIALRRPDRGVYLAFNAEIAKEAGVKMIGTRCTARTMHSLAYAAVVGQGGGRLTDLTMNDIKNAIDVDRYRFPKLPGWTAYRISSLVKRTLAKFCASDDTIVMPHHATDALIDTMGDPSKIRDDERRQRAEDALERFSLPAALAAQDLFTGLVGRGEYSHDSYLKMLDLEADMRNNAFRGQRYILLDEAQDLNPVQRSIVTKTGLPLVAVGDPYQQIYSWRGAQNALDLLPGNSLYLTQSFRFGENIAKVARLILSERPDGGPEQQLIGTERTTPIRSWEGPKGAWICRTNMGVLDTGLRSAERARHKIFIDNFGEIVSDVRVARALHDNTRTEAKSTRLATFTNFAEIEAEAESGDAELTRLVKIIKEKKDPDVFKLAELCVADEKSADITIITGHRSKGREWPTVGLGSDWKSMDEMHAAHKKSQRNSAAAETQAIEQFNVLYVALTRAMQTLKDPMERLYPDTKRPDPIVEEYNRHAAMAAEASHLRLVHSTPSP